MKKIWIFIFSFLIFLASATNVLATSNVVFAQEDEATPSSKVDYKLPYPGLLPNHPLYFLKITRDRILDFLISDPLKKAEFDLLAADKRLSAALYLSHKGSKEKKLVEPTASKAENYFEKAIAKAKQAKKQGEDIKDLLRRLKESSLKHMEVLKELNLSSEANRAAKFHKEVELLILENETQPK